MSFSFSSLVSRGPNYKVNNTLTMETDHWIKTRYSCCSHIGFYFLVFGFKNTKTWKVQILKCFFWVLFFDINFVLKLYGYYFFIII